MSTDADGARVTIVNAGPPDLRLRTFAIVTITVANAIGGISYAWQKLAIDVGLGPGTITASRNLIALILLASYMAVRTGFRLAMPAKDLLRVALIGVFGLGCPLVLGVVGVQWSTATNGSILILLEPVAILVFSWVLLREPVSRRQIGGVVLGLVGAGLVVVHSAEALGQLFANRFLVGNLVLALHGVMWGLYSPTMKPLAERYRAIDLTFLVMFFGMAPMAPLAIWEIAQGMEIADPLAAIGYVLLLAVLGSIVATVLWNYSLRHLRASTVAPFVFLQPLCGGIVGHLLFDDPFTTLTLIGAMAIAIAVVLVAFGGRSASRRRRAAIDSASS